MVKNWQINNSANDNSRLSFLVGYLYDEKKVKDFFNITNSYDFTFLMVMRKNSFLVELTKKHNKYPSKAGLDLLYSPTKKFPAVLIQSLNNITRIFNGRAQRFLFHNFIMIEEI